MGVMLALLMPPAAAQAEDPTPAAVTCDGGTPAACSRTRVAPPAEPGAPGPRRSAATLPTGTNFWELQLNLCNSGIASCYTRYNNGQAVGEAAGVIRAQWPDLVTLNEICEADVMETLFATMREIWPGDWVYSGFMPAYDRGRNAPYLCANGDEYGIGILGHVPAPLYEEVRVFGDVYPDSHEGSPTQDTGSSEKRAWLCAYAVGNSYGCTTHLASSSGSIAANQCRYLMSGIVPGLWSSQGATKPSVMGGDLNLRFRGWPDAQACVPPGWFRKGDGDVQHVMATNDFAFDFTRKIDLRRTDHDAWLVALVTR
ncbi:hypothetical protein GCM10022226_42440 [Sphaerisporangium flaviroseum]|uniref:Endonuclease/exonuclease/phosphatase family protein n=1 Tax=Sphaerisporangium flaviroseum TaxID=509199 RepID=A0ABP7IFU5_9ACTN